MEAITNKMEKATFFGLSGEWKQFEKNTSPKIILTSQFHEKEPETKQCKSNVDKQIC